MTEPIHQPTAISASVYYETGEVAGLDRLEKHNLNEYRTDIINNLTQHNSKYFNLHKYLNQRNYIQYIS